GDELDAVRGNLVAPYSKEIRGRHPVAREETLHMRRGCVTRLASVHDDDPPPRAANDQCGAQTCRAASDHHHVVRFRLHWCERCRIRAVDATKTPRKPARATGLRQSLSDSGGRI